jgi:hypothetical protein
MSEEKVNLLNTMLRQSLFQQAAHFIPTPLPRSVLTSGSIERAPDTVIRATFLLNKRHLKAIASRANQREENDSPDTSSGE